MSNHSDNAPKNHSSDRLTSLEKEMVRAILNDRKQDRRWRNARAGLIAFILILYAVLIFSPARPDILEQDTRYPYVSLVQLDGVILPGTGFSAERVIPLLNRAFEDKDAKGVVIVINSPGGSPVQASIIHDKIIQLKRKYHKKVVVEGEDVLASGAYLVATAADKIYVHKDTITGSIGVILSSFGFTGLMEKIGVSRRVYTAGTNKDRLDPFLPATEADKAKIDHLLAQVHQNFITDVKKGRQGKLHGDDSKLFSGDFWSGQEATRLGLVDGTANIWDVMRKEFNVSYYRSYSEKTSLLQNILRDFGTALNLRPLQSKGPALKAELGAGAG